MMALGVVALAATVQAATFRWYNSAAIAAAGDSGTGPSGSTIGRGEGRHLLAGLYPRHFLHAAVQYRGDDV